MASYLYSNQPYQRVDDGIGAGLVGGVIAGGALAGGLHAFGSRGLNSLKETNRNLGLTRAMKVGESYYEQNSRLPEGIAREVNNVLQVRDLDRIENQHKTIQAGINKLENLYSKGFKSGGLRAAGVYAGSILGGALLGAGIDAING